MKKHLLKIAMSVAVAVPLTVLAILPADQRSRVQDALGAIGRVATERPDKESTPPEISRRTSEAGLKSAADYTFRVRTAPEKAPVVPESAPVFGCTLSKPYSLISLPTDGETTSATTIATDENFNANGGGVCDGTTYYSVSYFDYGWTTFTTIYKFDAETWEYQGLKNANGSAVSTDMAYDAITGKIYGCFKNDSGTGYVFGILNPDNATRQAIKNLDEAWNACAVAKDGTLYAITMSGTLYTVNKNTGEMTSVGETGVKPFYMASAVIDQRSGRFYWTAAPETGNAGLYEVEPATGAATLLYELPADLQIAGLYIPIPDADDNAPNTPYSLKANFEKGSTEGTVTFTVPATTFAGAALTGTVGYTLIIEGPESSVINGNANPEENVTVPVSLTKAGNYDFTVRLSNEHGDSPKATTSTFVGMGTPKPVTITGLTFENGRATLRWEAVTASSDGGYFDPEAVTYTVRRYPADQIVMSGAKDTEFTETLPDGELTVNHYTVTAECNGALSEAVESGRFVTGVATVPYTESFDTENALAAYTILDGNEDGKQWEYYESRVRMRYSMTAQMDDWLITPPVRLKKGWTYRFAFYASAHNDSDPERLEVKFGTSATIGGMTTELIAPTVISGKTPVLYEGFASISEDGNYYFGIHGISDADKYYLYVDDISVIESYSNDVPDVPSAFNVSPYASGELKADISVTAPAKAISGDNLTSISRLVVSRDNEVIKEFANATPGAEYTFTDEGAEHGPHTYSAYAVNEAGDGKVVTARVYIGVNVPKAPKTAHVVETTTPGEVTISWDVPESDVDGNPINPDLITYHIITQDDDNNVIEVADNVRETSYTYQAIAADGKQDVVVYAVHAKTSAGESEDFAKTEIIFAGPDYTLPYADSFPGGHLGEYIYVINTINGSYAGWSLSSEMSQDDDGGCIGFIGGYRGDEATLCTGKISLRDTESPVLQFYYYAVSSSTSTLKVLVKDFGSDEGYTDLRTITLNESGLDGWVKATCSLDAYKGKTVSIMFDATAGSTTAVAIDNINVLDRPAHDIIAAAISAPAKVKTGEKAVVAVTVENFGANTAENYTVQLFCNDEMIGQKSGPAIASDAAATIEFEFTPGVASPEKLQFEAVAVYAPDLNTDNNRISAATAVDFPNYPKATGLTAQAAGKSIELSWSAPDLSTAIGNPVTEDFESYPAGTYTGMGEWILIDKDGLRNASLAEQTGTSTSSFFVYDTTGKDPASFSAHSGLKMMASVYPIDEKGTQCDDWMISPELPGCAQTISLFARSQRASYPESFEILYSTGSTETDDFVLLETFSGISADWTEYTADLPAGALRFAVRCISNDCYMLSIDDITFIPASSKPEELVVLGYNIYRDKTLVNESPVAETSYVDTQVPAGVHNYQVSVVYDKGESALSDAASAETSSISAIGTSSVSIAAGESCIIVGNAAGMEITVYTPDGKTVASATGSARTEIAVAPGLYVVKAGTTVAKVAVR